MTAHEQLVKARGGGISPNPARLCLAHPGRSTRQGLPTLIDAAKIWKGAGADALAEIRSRKWKSENDKEGVLS